MKDDEPTLVHRLPDRVQVRVIERHVIADVRIYTHHPRRIGPTVDLSDSLVDHVREDRDDSLQAMRIAAAEVIQEAVVAKEEAYVERAIIQRHGIRPLADH